MEHPRRERRWTRRKEGRAAELISAAPDLFVARGFSATRLEDVACRAGMSKGTLFLFCQVKEDLFKAFVHGGIVQAIDRAPRGNIQFDELGIKKVSRTHPFLLQRGDWSWPQAGVFHSNNVKTER